MGVLPFSIDDPERDVLIRRSSAEVQQYSLVVARLLDDLVSWSLGFVDKVGIEYIELGPNSVTTSEEGIAETLTL